MAAAAAPAPPLNPEEIDIYTCPPLPTLQELFPLYNKILAYNYRALLEAKFDKLASDVLIYPEIEGDPLVPLSTGTQLLNTSLFEEIEMTKIQPGRAILFKVDGPSIRDWSVTAETAETFSYPSFGQSGGTATIPKKNDTDEGKVEIIEVEKNGKIIQFVPPYMFNNENTVKIMSGGEDPPPPPPPPPSVDVRLHIHRLPTIVCIIIHEVDHESFTYSLTSNDNSEQKIFINTMQPEGASFKRLYKRLNESYKLKDLIEEVDKISKRDLGKGKPIGPVGKSLAINGIPEHISGYLPGPPVSPRGGGTRRKRPRKGRKKRKTRRLKSKKRLRKNKYSYRSK